MNKTPSETITTIDLLRHGECEGGDIFRGHKDVTLSKDGWNTMQQSIKTHALDIPWDTLISSPLKRCYDFAESIAAKHNINLEPEDGFRELHYGDWDGLERQFLWDNYKESLELLYSDPVSFKAPNGESIPEFQQRVLLAWENIINKHHGKHLLLIQHGGTIRILLTHLLSMPMASMVKINVPYGSFSRINIYHSDKTDNVVLMYHH